MLGAEAYRVVSVGSLPPELGGQRPGGVASFHRSLLEGLRNFPERVVHVGVIPVGSYDGRAVPDQLTLYPRHRSVSPAEHLRRVIDATGCSAVLLNHVANEWGRAAVGLDDCAAFIGIHHSWTPVMRRENPFPVSELKRILDSCSAVVVPSSYMLQGFTAFGVGPLNRPPFVIPHPCSPPREPRWDRPRDGVLFVGNLGSIKNVGGLVAAVGHLPRMPLTVIGEGSQRNMIEDEVSRLGLADRVTLTGSLPQEAVFAHMESVKVLCLPSFSESFGLVMVEALMHGTPVVGFGPTMSEMCQRIGASCGVALGANDPDSIASALTDALEADWNHRDLSERTLRSFASGSIIGEYVRLIESTVSFRLDAG